jgi:hypothetical protein
VAETQIKELHKENTRAANVCRCEQDRLESKAGRILFLAQRSAEKLGLANFGMPQVAGLRDYFPQ